jgi:hypothetical protein
VLGEGVVASAREVELVGDGGAVQGGAELASTRQRGAGRGQEMHAISCRRRGWWRPVYQGGEKSA